jgi:hypothetical protein
VLDKQSISFSILWQAITQNYTSMSPRCSRVLTSTNSNPTYPLNKVSGHFMALRWDRLIHILDTINTWEDSEILTINALN